MWLTVSSKGVLHQEELGTGFCGRQVGPSAVVSGRPWAGPVATLVTLPSHAKGADSGGWLTSAGLVVLCPRAFMHLLLLLWMLLGGVVLYPGGLPTSRPV